MSPVFSFSTAWPGPASLASGVLHATIGTDGVSFWAKDGTNKTLALKSWQFTGYSGDPAGAENSLRQLFGAEDTLGQTFSTKICALSSPPLTLVPRRLFTPDHLAPYFKLLLRDGTAYTHGYEVLEEFDCVLIWAVSPGLYHLCRAYFADHQISHLAVPLLRAYHQLSPEEGYAVYANLRGNKVQIAVLERKNLVFFNVFEFNKPSDLLYYILLAYKQFDLNPLEITLTLSGTLMEDSDAFRLLARYIRPLRFPPLFTSGELPESAKSLPVHYWFDLSTL
ncbi:MAG: DUF3822 family protein [Saprospiraceae bacterium]|nr:DUF3822 family protein [Saprospiraceae bacterium]